MTLLPVVEFHTEDGMRVEFMNKWAENDEELQYIIGENVEVVYNSELPEEAAIKQSGFPAAICFLLAALGTIILLLPKQKKISGA